MSEDAAKLAVLEERVTSVISSLEKVSIQLTTLEKLTTVMEIMVKEIPDIKTKLRKLEEKDNKRTGALAMAMVLGGIFSALISNIKSVVSFFVHSGGQ